MARAALGWSTKKLADAAAVGVNTVSRFEQGGNTTLQTIKHLSRALSAAGVEFIPENGKGPGVRLSKAAKSKA